MFVDYPEEFQILPGHKELLYEVGVKIQDEHKLLVTPSRNLSDVFRREQVHSPKEKKNMEDLFEAQSILVNIIDKALLRDFNIKTKKGDPQYVVTLESELSGHILCQIDDCKKRNHKQAITRSVKRPWSTQNFYRHVRAVHFDAKRAKLSEDQDEDSRFVTLSDEDMEKSDKESDSNNNMSSENSKWKKATYSRSERNQRALQASAASNHRITQYFPVLNLMEKTIKENEHLHSTVKLLLERLKESKDSPAPTVSAFLQALNESAMQNENKKIRGGRFLNIDGLSLMCTHIFLLCGPRGYNGLQGNMQNIMPAQSTILDLMKKNKQVIVEGQFRWDELSQFLDEREYTREIVVQEDGTRCVTCVQYDSSSNQLVGLVPKLQCNGLPAVLSFPATTEEEIRRHFESGTLARYMYFIVARPLQDNASAFVLCAFGSDNKFSQEQVTARWEEMHKESERRNIAIRAFATDGDPRCLAAMKAMFFSPCQNTLAWHFHFRADLKRNMVFVQDPTHVATKLRNLLLRKNVLCIGNYYISVAHIKFLMENFSKDQHLLTEGDLNPKDRMNFRSAEKLFSENTTGLLINIPDSEDTRAFLNMGRAAVEAFLDRKFLPEERIRMVWTSLFFYRGWRKWVQNHPQFNLSTNFLTTNAYVCVEINAHALVLLVKFYRDNKDKLNLGDFAPWLWSSQECEALFRILRSLTSTLCTMINFSVLECIQRVTRVALEEMIRKKLGSKFFFAESRRAGKRRAETVISDTFPSDSKILEIMDEAKVEAQSTLINLGVNSGVPSVFSSIPEVEPEQDSDSESEEPQALTSRPLEPIRDERDSEEESDDPVEEGPMVSLFAGSVGLRSFPNAVVTPDGPYVKVKDAHGVNAIIKKSALVWMLASRAQLSNDRTARVREGEVMPSTTPRCTAHLPQQRGSIAIGDWCAFRVPRSRRILVGHVLLFSHMGKGKTQRQYSPATAPTTSKNVGVTCDWYCWDQARVLRRQHMDGPFACRYYTATLKPPTLEAEGKLLIDANTEAFMRSLK